VGEKLQDSKNSFSLLGKSRFAGLASRKIFRAGNKKQKVDTLGPPTHPRVSKKVLP